MSYEINEMTSEGFVFSLDLVLLQNVWSYSHPRVYIVLLVRDMPNLVEISIFQCGLSYKLMFFILMFVPIDLVHHTFHIPLDCTRVLKFSALQIGL